MTDEMLATLGSGPLYRFADWPNEEVPNWPCGVYTVWDGPSLVYVGMAGRSLAADAHLQPEARASKRNRGLRDRLQSHASGRRSGDQFCVYVCDRLVLSDFTQADLTDVAAGRVSLDERTKDYIRKHLSYRFVVTDSGQHARELEGSIQLGALDGRKPLLNPR